LFLFQVFLSLAGLLSVVLSISSSYGICCTLGFAFSPLHNFIPFLLLGLGWSFFINIGIAKFSKCVFCEFKQISCANAKIWYAIKPDCDNHPWDPPNVVIGQRLVHNCVVIFARLGRLVVVDRWLLFRGGHKHRNANSTFKFNIQIQHWQI
jgi:hypothetical protein